MEGLMHFLQQSDAVGGSVALLLLTMSIGGWALIIWKTLVLRRAMGDLNRAIPAFWDAASLDEGRARLGGLDRERLLSLLVDAARQAPAGASLATQGLPTPSAPGACETRCSRAWGTCSSARWRWPPSAAPRPSSGCSAPSGASTTPWWPSAREAPSPSTRWRAPWAKPW